MAASGSNRITPTTIGIWDVVGRDLEFNSPVMGIVPWRAPFAKVKAVRGDEQQDEAGGQRYGATTWLLDFDFYDVEGLKHDMKIEFEGVVIDITDIRPDLGRKRSTLVVGIERETPVE